MSTMEMIEGFAQSFLKKFDIAQWFLKIFGSRPLQVEKGGGENLKVLYLELTEALYQQWKVGTIS